MQYSIISRKPAYSGFLKIETRSVRYDSFHGHAITAIDHEVLDRGDSAAVLIYELETDSFLFTRQFRSATASVQMTNPDTGWLLEIPAGMLDEGEDSVAAAKREVLEEVGYALSTLKPIYTFYLSPGISTERVFLFYAETRQQDRLHTGGGLSDEHEDIELVKIPVAQAMDNINSGMIIDAKTIVALQWWLLGKN